MDPNHELAESEPFHDALYESLKHWGLRADGAELLRDGVNHVFATQSLTGAPVIVRISDGAHRPRHELEGELIWLDWLIAHDCVVTTPIRSKQGELLETHVSASGEFHVSCFERFAGHQPNPGNPHEWSEDFFVKVGRSVGQIHRVTDMMTLPSDKDRAPWWETELHCFPEDTSAYDSATVEAMQAFLDEFKNRAQTPRYFGLIHHDVHGGNILVDQGEVKMIDFDLACYGWRMQDFAVLLYSHYYFLSWRPPNTTDALIGEVLAALTRGYREEYQLDDEQLAMMPDLLRLRETLCYILMRPAMDYWHKAVGSPAVTVRESMARVEARWRNGESFEIPLP